MRSSEALLRWIDFINIRKAPVSISLIHTIMDRIDRTFCTWRFCKSWARFFYYIKSSYPEEFYTNNVNLYRFEALEHLTLGKVVVVWKTDPCDLAHTILEDDPPDHVEVTVGEFIFVAVLHAISTL